MDTKAAFLTCVSAVLASAITAGVMYYNNERNLETKLKQAETERLEARRDSEESKKLAQLRIENTYVPRVKTNIDSIFYTEVVNTSKNPALKANILVNFGGTEIRACETLPINRITPASIKNGSVLNLPDLDLSAGEKIYIYCQTSAPMYESINVSGDNLSRAVKQTIQSRGTKTQESGNGYLTFFGIVGSIVALLFIGFFTFAGIAFLSKKLGPYLE